MSIEEKAKELYNKYYTQLSKSDTCFGDCNVETHLTGTCSGTGHGCGIWKIYAKECALIAVKELQTQSYQYGMVYDLSFDETTSYWYKVKQEIEKL